jgi:mannose-6-phosphate isomerase
MSLYPFFFRPVYKDYFWGGDKILRLYGRREPPGIYAESWEVSDRAEGMSVVRNGPLAGKTLHDLVEEFGSDLLGARVRASAFPLLLKLIDARGRLSAQVHPDDEAARKYGGEAKTEMWYILDAEPGAGVFIGLKPGANEGKLRQAIQTKRVEELLQFMPVSKGDAVFVPGGRVHAIGAGCLLLEVEQNSNTTYRICDWDRVDRDGKPRPLHVEEAMRAVRWSDADEVGVRPRRLGNKDGVNERWEILSCSYFVLERLVISDTLKSSGDGGTFEVLFVASGGAEVQWGQSSESLPAGTSCLIPAALGEYALRPSIFRTEVLRVAVP